MEGSIGMGTENITFGVRLRSLRRQKRLSQKELADMVGMDHTYLSKIETEALPPPSEKNIKAGPGFGDFRR
jgi:transcriptional regulator with XRE-family HTH domain